MNNKLKNNIYFVSSIVISIFITLETNYICPWRKLFHIYCAGCGVTRMIESLIKLNIYQAYRYNPLFFILILLFLIYLIYILISKILKQKCYKLNSNLLWAMLILIILFTILRNIPGFEYLRPTKV